MAESRLDVVINPSRAQSGARAVKSSIDGLKNSWMEFTAKIFLAEQAATRTWRALSQGAEFEENFARLNRQAGQYNQTSTQLVETLQRTVSGQLSMAEATQVASRAMAQGLNPDQINTFAQAADSLGDVMGTDVKGGFDAILQGLATGRTQILANIGVYVDLEQEVKDLALATGRTTDEITKQEKAAIGASAVMKQLDGSLNKLGDGSISNADKMGAMEKKLEDIAMKSKQAGVGLLFGYMASMENATKATQEAFPIFKQWGDWVDEHIFNVPKMELDVSLKGKPGEPPKGPDPKLLQIAASAELEQRRAAFDAQERLAQETNTRVHNDLRAMFERNELARMEYLKRDADLDMKALDHHRNVLGQRIAMEHEGFVKSSNIGFETTEQKLEAEKTFNAAVEALRQERVLTDEQWHTRLFKKDQDATAARLQLEEEKGQRITDSLVSQFQIETDLRQRAQDNAIAYYSNLAKFQEAYGTTREQQMTTEYDLVRANLAKQLDTTYDVAAKILNAWRNNDHIRAEELLGNTKLTAQQVTAIWMGAMADQRNVSEKFSDDLFAGFAKSMRRYVTDQSVFGLGVDQARRVAQGMEQGFQKFFFDSMEGKITGLKDVLQGVADFAQTIVADFASKLATRGLLTGFDAMMGGMGGGIGSAPTNVPWMAAGGITHGPSLAGEAGPEAVVPLPDGRSIPVEWKGGPYGAPDRMVSTVTPAPQVNAPVEININNHATDTDIKAESHMRPDGTKQIDIVVTNIVRNGFRDGAFDHVMKQNFGNSRKPGRR
jgi:hypothetical protein